LIQDPAGNLYGTTEAGGIESSACNHQSIYPFTTTCGVVFKLVPCDSSPSSYDFEVLYTFTRGADGEFPLPT
jgi:hypothetical protein